MSDWIFERRELIVAAADISHISPSDSAFQTALNRLVEQLVWVFFTISELKKWQSAVTT